MNADAFIVTVEKFFNKSGQCACFLLSAYFFFGTVQHIFMKLCRKFHDISNILCIYGNEFYWTKMNICCFIVYRVAEFFQTVFADKGIFTDIKNNQLAVNIRDGIESVIFPRIFSYIQIFLIQPYIITIFLKREYILPDQFSVSIAVADKNIWLFCIAGGYLIKYFCCGHSDINFMNRIRVGFYQTYFTINRTVWLFLLTGASVQE